MQLDFRFERPEVRLQYVEGELSHHSTLLKNVSLTESGIALCKNPNGIETLLAAVKVSDDLSAEIVPLTKGSRRLHMALPSDGPSRIGFFVGLARKAKGDFSLGIVGGLSASLRVGEYPGEALTTEPTTEVPFDVSGFKNGAAEQQHQVWFQDLGLDAQRFSPNRTRGLFTQGRKVMGGWEDRDLRVVPEGSDPLLFQILVHESAPGRMRSLVSLAGAFEIAANIPG